MKPSHLALLGVAAAAVALVVLARRGALPGFSLAPAAPAPRPTQQPARRTGAITGSDFDPTNPSARFGPVVVRGVEQIVNWAGGLFGGGDSSAPSEAAPELLNW